MGQSSSLHAVGGGRRAGRNHKRNWTEDMSSILANANMKDGPFGASSNPFEVPVEAAAAGVRNSNLAPKTIEENAGEGSGEGGRARSSANAELASLARLEEEGEKSKRSRGRILTKT